MKRRTTKTVTVPARVVHEVNEYHRSVKDLSTSELLYRLQRAQADAGACEREIATLVEKTASERKALARMTREATILTSLIDERR